MKLYGYWQSSASYRARIALNLKGLAYETVPVDLKRDGGGEQFGEAYRAVNPNTRVPALVTDDGTVLTQSLAIIEWLDEIFPSPPFLPSDPVERARCRALAQVVVSDIQPLQGLSVLKRLKHRQGATNEDVAEWVRFWIGRGFEALEAEAAARTSPGRFLFGDAPSALEIVLVPQMYNARLWTLDLAPFPRLAALDEAARAMPAFAKAAPEAQPDAPTHGA